jgi:hypothetical protein
MNRTTAAMSFATGGPWAKAGTRYSVPVSFGAAGCLYCWLEKYFSRGDYRAK